MIEDLVERFRQIPGARVGRGPDHPREPDPSIAQRLDAFLADYPFLNADQTYVEFLRKYGGAFIQNERLTQIVDILGFADVSTDIVEMDGPVVDSAGFLVFAQCVYHIRDGQVLGDTQEHDFAFDATGRRKPGVHHVYADSTHLDGEYEWRFPNFAAWLADLVAQDGMLRPPGAK